jgi:hypothetical protein
MFALLVLSACVVLSHSAVNDAQAARFATKCAEQCLEVHANDFAAECNHYKSVQRFDEFASCKEFRRLGKHRGCADGCTGMPCFGYAGTPAVLGVLADLCRPYERAADKHSSLNGVCRKEWVSAAGAACIDSSTLLMRETERAAEEAAAYAAAAEAEEVSRVEAALAAAQEAEWAAKHAEEQMRLRRESMARMDAARRGESMAAAEAAKVGKVRGVMRPLEDGPVPDSESSE